MIYIFLLVVLSTVSGELYAQPFAYDCALYAGQHHEWQKARDALCGLVVEQPDYADLSYDAGVASFHAGDIKQSVAYFERAALLTESKSLKERAYFNCGNAYAHDKQFALALSSYESALAINPNNEKTKHNYEVVKKLLEQQEQDNQEQQDDSEDNDESDSSQDENSNDQNGDDDSQKQDNNNESHQEQNNASDGDGESQDEQSSDDKESQSSDIDNEHANKDESPQQSNRDDDSSVNQNDNQNKQAQSDLEEDHKEGGGDQHDDELRDEQEDKKVGAPLNEALEKEENQWIVSLLEQQEAHDNSVNKQFLRARLKEGATSGHGGHNW